jgi:hypothetical protein
MDGTVRAVAVTILLSLRWRARDARNCHHRTRFFGHERFTDAPHRDGSHGLGGQELRFRTHKYTEHARWYQAAAGAGNACRLKTECTDSPKRRQVTRSFAEAYLERVRGDHATKEFEGHAQTHSLGGTPVRRSQGLAWAAPLPPAGSENVNSEALLIAAGQNLKRLLSHRGWGRRPCPSGAAGVILPVLPFLPALAP